MLPIYLPIMSLLSCMNQGAMRGEPFAESRATLRREGLLTYASCSAYWLPFTTAKVPPLVAYLSPPWQCPSSPPCAFSARAWRLWGSSALPG